MHFFVPRCKVASLPGNLGDPESQIAIDATLRKEIEAIFANRKK